MLGHLEADRVRVAELEAQIFELERSIAELRAEKAIAQERLDARVAELKAQVLDLECSIADLQTEKAMVQQRLDSYPVLTLPDEIIAEIFVRFLPSYPICPPFVGPLSPISLTHICHRWRAVALATPTLWKAIEFRYSYNFECPAFPLAGAWLSRSGSCPLSISILRANSTNLPDILSAIVPHRARWEHLKLGINAESLLHLFGGPMPLLRHLDLTLPSCKPCELRAVDLPRLCSAKVFDDPAARSVTLPLAQLTSLVLWTVAPSVVVSILHQAPRLVYCVLGCQSQQFSFVGVDHLTIPCLKTLVLIAGDGFVHDFLANLYVPALHRLEFREGTNSIALLTALISMSVKLQEINVMRRTTLENPKRLSENDYRAAFPSITFSFEDGNKPYSEY
ncbi:hypothetical protein C8R45DRAFT_313508 [Mycena sanguinolenta]|nr:hypothetical protein C8R45DRAFT_313508 [Mycena sanguinolenta]